MFIATLLFILLVVTCWLLYCKVNTKYDYLDVEYSHVALNSDRKIYAVDQNDVDCVSKNPVSDFLYETYLFNGGKKSCDHLKVFERRYYKNNVYSHNEYYAQFCIHMTMKNICEKIELRANI